MASYHRPVDAEERPCKCYTPNHTPRKERACRTLARVVMPLPPRRGCDGVQSAYLTSLRRLLVAQPPPPSHLDSFCDFAPLVERIKLQSSRDQTSILIVFLSRDPFLGPLHYSLDLPATAKTSQTKANKPSRVSVVSSTWPGIRACPRTRLVIFFPEAIAVKMVSKTALHHQKGNRFG